MSATLAWIDMAQGTTAIRTVNAINISSALILNTLRYHLQHPSGRLVRQLPLPRV
jgi:hypothetical protein